jgi:uncharacterized protein YndB with AHSA1/START domain
MKISVEVLVAAPIAKVWESYTSPSDIVKWNFASEDWHTPNATVDLRVGGIFSSRMESKDGTEGFDFEGVYTNIIEHELIGYSFGDRNAKVEFSNEPTGVRVAVTFDAEDMNTADQQRAGWQAILDNFAAHVVSE